VRARWRWFVAGGAIALLCVVGAGVGYYRYVSSQGADVRASSTVEFVPTEAPPTTVPKPARPPNLGKHESAALRPVDWPTFGFDSRRLRYPPRGLAPPFRVAGVFHGRNLLEFPPGVAYGRAYIANNSGVLFPVRAATGRTSWRYRSGCCAAASPAVAGEVVYMAFLNRRRRGKEACTGRRRSGTSSSSSARTATRFYALDAATGDVVWLFEANGPISGSATVLGNIVYFSTLKGRTYGLDAKTGKRVWSFPDGKYSPVVAGPDRVYLVGYTRMYGLVPARVAAQ
jgi:outer membrane protein assembly factor BamB